MGRISKSEWDQIPRDRQIDLDRMYRAKNDYTKGEKERKKAAESLYILAHQNKDKYVQKLREELRIATLNDDKAKIDQLVEKGKRYDQDYRY